MYSDQDPEKAMEFLRNRGLDTSVEVGSCVVRPPVRVRHAADAPLVAEAAEYANGAVGDVSVHVPPEQLIVPSFAATGPES